MYRSVVAVKALTVVYGLLLQKHCSCCCPFPLCARCSSMCPSLSTRSVSAFVPSPPQLPVFEEAWPRLCRLSCHWPHFSPSQTPARVFRVTRAKDGAWPHPNLLFFFSCPKSVSEFGNSNESHVVLEQERLEGEITSDSHVLPWEGWGGRARECKATLDAFWEL